MAKEVLKPNRKLFLAKKGHKPYSKSYSKFIWQESERQLGMWFKDHDNVDPFFKKAETSCGRVGHLSGLRMDVITKNFVGENKSREDCPSWLKDAVIVALTKSEEWRRPALIRLDFYGEIYENVLGLDRLPDMFLITVDDLGLLLDELMRLRDAEK